MLLTCDMSFDSRFLLDHLLSSLIAFTLKTSERQREVSIFNELVIKQKGDLPGVLEK